MLVTYLNEFKYPVCMSVCVCVCVVDGEKRNGKLIGCFFKFEHFHQPSSLLPYSSHFHLGEQDLGVGEKNKEKKKRKKKAD